MWTSAVCHFCRMFMIKDMLLNYSVITTYVLENILGILVSSYLKKKVQKQEQTVAYFRKDLEAQSSVEWFCLRKC